MHVGRVSTCMRWLLILLFALPAFAAPRAVILGDSVARGAGDERGGGIASALASHFDVTNLGINGGRTFQVRRLLARPAAQAAVRAADVVILSIGGNDLYGDTPARLLATIWPARQQQRAVTRVAGLVAHVRKLNPNARIYILGLYDPYRHAWLSAQVNLWDSRLIRRFARAQNVVVVRIADLFDRGRRISTLDRFHPGHEGYAAIAERILASLR